MIYRVFLLDSQDNISACEELVANADEDALQQARSILDTRKHYNACEVWQERGKIDRIVRKI
jgi:hypothetical protein